MSFVGNAAVEMVDVHLAFDATPGITERDFMQVHLVPEAGLPTQGRMLDIRLFTEFLEALKGAPDMNRLLRAIGHYDLALGHWYVGGESLAVGHLFMAAETLVPTMLRVRLAAEQATEEELAVKLGVRTDDPRWRTTLAARIRVEDVFAGDSETHRAAKEASDGLEHGFMEISSVIERALAATEKTFEYVRQAILRVIGVPEALGSELMAKDPVDTKSLRKAVRGQFIGPGDDVAAPNEMYPQLIWNSAIDRIRWTEPGRLEPSFTENFKVVCAEGAGFRVTSIEARGRLRPGQGPVEAVLKVE